MSAELSRSQTPNNGWMFFNASTGWTLPNPVSVTFDQAVILIIKHRLSNPAITAKHNLHTTKAEVSLELEAYTRARLGMSPVGQPDPPKPGAAPKAARCCGQ